ncbi:glycosyltransferase family 2 protein [Streptomyces sp. BK239]|uniref:glycosyltransferase n=1 Tax=Streptomyces sp. BK239 TaxID=2512155 RepID=UPI0010EC333E|nr:glycosyltransferase family A protein [Streptomyces sp. BK239]RZU16987.1 GT2 family glycosyltransferase [Streptomyces sp. BK239]
MSRAPRVQREIRRFLDIGPVQVAELDLPDGDACAAAGGDARGEVTLRPGPGSPPVTHGEVFLLVRRGGRPVGTLLGRVPEGADPRTFLAARARERVGPRPAATAPPAPSTTVSTPPAPSTTVSTPPAPSTTVVIATREHADRLAHALDSLLAQDHPDFEIVVVDNAPTTDTTRELIERKYGERVRHIVEPVPGLAVAHNRGVRAAHGEVVAFTDDDVVADPRWLTELTAPFAADPGLGCVTGLILPALLRTPAQVLLESHGGFAKGFRARTYDPYDPPADEPLFPFTAGRFGSGANMAFRADVLRAVGGFDPATGVGTPARGGDDLYGFVRVLAQGHRLHYTPLALVWHHHRQTWRDLENQAYGYGAGLTAYLTALLVNRPSLLPAFLARLPRGLAHARTLTAGREAGAETEARAGVTDGARAGAGAGVEAGARSAPGGYDERTHAWPRRLSRLQRRGMLYGPVGYLRARRALVGPLRRSPDVPFTPPGGAR